MVETDQVHCPCGEAFEVTAASNLHVTYDPALRAAILRGGFHVFACPSCGAQVQHEKVLAYTDFDRQHWFAVFPESALATWREATDYVETSFRATIEDYSPPVVKSWAPKLRPGMRAVFGLPALREKLLLADAGLDDRMIEVLKLEVIKWYDLSYRQGAQLWFSHREGDVLMFAWAEASGPNQAAPALLPVAFEAYERLVCDRATSRAIAPILHDSTAVDFRIAGNAA